MKKKPISVGDLVLRCVKWRPGVEATRNTGKGIVTLIAEPDGEKKRLIRVLWREGNFEWHSEEDLVNVKNIIRGSIGSD